MWNFIVQKCAILDIHAATDACPTSERLAHSNFWLETENKISRTSNQETPNPPKHHNDVLKEEINL